MGGWFGTLPTPCLAVLPDLVEAGDSSAMFSYLWAGVIEGCPEAADWPWYLPIQDNMNPMNVMRLLDECDWIAGLFLGGSDDLKQAKEAGFWCDLAHRCNRAFHFARAGTKTKLEAAFEVGADSIDSSLPLRARGGEGIMLYRFADWVADLQAKHGPSWLEQKEQAFSDAFADAVLVHGATHYKAA